MTEADHTDPARTDLSADAPIIRFEQVSKRFGTRRVLEDAAFEIMPGRSYGLSGPNGSGKSVLLQLMCALVEPTSGRVRIAERYLPDSRTFPDRFGIAINGPAYLAGLSAIDNLRELARIRNRASEEELRTTLVEVGLDPDSRQRVRSFSLGMKQKLSLAQAFIESPEVLLLDEPFNALDEASVARIGAALDARRARGATLVLTSHHRAELDAHCDERLSIRDGSVIRG